MTQPDSLDVRTRSKSTQLVCRFLMERMHEACYLLDKWSVAMPTEPPPERKNGDELWDWLEAENRWDVLNNVQIQNTAAAVAADMLAFLYAALDALESGQVTVAYSLLRKPMREHLTILEWLLVEPDDFAKGMRSRIIADREPTKLDQRRLRKLIGDVCTKVGYKQSHADFIYELRHTKKKPGLLGFFHMATHLVTGARDIETELHNLNFVFADGEIRREHLDYIDLVLPWLLLYASDVVESLALGFNGRTGEFEQFQFRRLFVHTALAGEAGACESMLDRLKVEMPDTMCPSCEATMAAQDFPWLELFMLGEVTCASCHESVRVSLTALLPEIADHLAESDISELRDRLYSYAMDDVMEDAKAPLEEDFGPEEAIGRLELVEQLLDRMGCPQDLEFHERLVWVEERAKSSG